MWMRSLAFGGGLVLLAVVLLDAFQSIVLPRRPVGRFRITRFFFLLTWAPWRSAVGLLRSRAAREQAYSVYGPLSLLLLFFVWAMLLLAGFGLVFFGLRVGFRDPLPMPMTEWSKLRSSLYVSGTTLVTLGLGDVVPETQFARAFTVLEAGTGLGFIALVIGYLPVLYTAFSHREVLVALLDARAGSPPTAAELLLRHGFDEGPQVLRKLLGEWEIWCAEMLETHISYPILCYYRSQHDNQSWLAALTAILDACALVITMMDGEQTRQAQLTFAIGRHVLVDLVHVFHQESLEKRLRAEPATRLPGKELMRLCQALEGTGFSPCNDFESRDRLQALRQLYEPSACALANHLKISLPTWVAPEEMKKKQDTWRAVSVLRSPQLTRGRFVTHVSGQSTAVNLDAHDE